MMEREVEMTLRVRTDILQRYLKCAGVLDLKCSVIDRPMVVMSVRSIKTVQNGARHSLPQYYRGWRNGKRALDGRSGKRGKSLL